MSCTDAGDSWYQSTVGPTETWSGRGQFLRRIAAKAVRQIFLCRLFATPVWHVLSLSPVLSVYVCTRSDHSEPAEFWARPDLKYSVSAVTTAFSINDVYCVYSRIQVSFGLLPRRSRQVALKMMRLLFFSRGM